MAAATSSDPTASPPMLLIAIEVKQPHQNIGTFIRLAAGFGARALIVVGSPKFAAHGAHGAQKHVPVIHFYDWNECSKLAELLNCDIYGVCNEAPSPPAASTPLNDAPDSSTSSGVAGRSQIHNPVGFNFCGQSLFIINPLGVLTESEARRCSSLLSVAVPSGPYALKHTLKYESIVGIVLNEYASVTAHTAEREFVDTEGSCGKFRVEFTTDHTDGAVDAQLQTLVDLVKDGNAAYAKRSKEKATATFFDDEDDSEMWDEEEGELGVGDVSDGSAVCNVGSKASAGAGAGALGNLFGNDNGDY